jgi:hypothetical protein
MRGDLGQNFVEVFPVKYILGINAVHQLDLVEPGKGHRLKCRHTCRFMQKFGTLMKACGHFYL